MRAKHLDTNAILGFAFPNRKPVAGHGAGNQPCDVCRKHLEFLGRENSILATVYDVRTRWTEPFEIVASTVSLRIYTHFGSLEERCQNKVWRSGLPESGHPEGGFNDSLVVEVRRQSVDETRLRVATRRGVA